MTIEDIRHLLRPTDDEVRWHQVVASLDAADAVPVLTSILSNPGEAKDTRRQAALILGLLANQQSVGALTKALTADDRILRGRAAEALGRFDKLDASTIEQLVELVRDEDGFARECAAKALAQLKCEAALPALEHMSKDDTIDENRKIARAAVTNIRSMS